MTVRSLYNPLVLHNLRQTIRQNKRLLIIICVLELLGFPLIAGAAFAEQWTDVMQKLRETDVYNSLPDFTLYSVIGGFCLGAAVVIGMAVGIVVFPELWKRSKVDMLYSLPLSGSQRFFSHYCSGCILYLVPYLAAVLLGWLVALGGSGIVYQANLALKEPETWTEIFLSFGTPYFQLTLGLFLLMLLYYTMTVLFTSCCGTLFESIYTNLLFQLLVPGTLAAVIAVMCDNTSLMRFDGCWTFIGWNSPIGGLIYLSWLIEGSDLSSSFLYYSRYSIAASEQVAHSTAIAYLLWAVKLVILTAALLFVALQLYKRRKAEDISKPFPYKALYFVMLTMLTVLILCMVNIGFEMLGPALLFSGIVYFVMEVIRKRGFRKFWHSVLAYAGTVAAVLILMLGVQATHCFYREYYIPPAAFIQSVKIELEDPVYDVDVTMEYKNRDVIATVQDWQKAANATYQEGGPTEAIEAMINEVPGLYTRQFYDGDGVFAYETDDSYRTIYTERIVLTYYDRFGGTCTRRYSANISQMQGMMEILRNTQLYRDAAADRIPNSISSNTYMEGTDDSLYQFSSVPVKYSATRNGDYSTIDMPPTRLYDLRDAYAKDLEQMTAEEWTECSVYGYIGNEIPVWDCCENTIAILEAYGCDACTTLEYLNGYDYYSEDFGAWAIRIYEPGTFLAPDLTYQAVNPASPYVQRNQAVYDKRIYTYEMMQNQYLELFAVLDAACQNPYGMTKQEGCYLICVNDRVMFLLPEYTDLIQDLLDAQNTSNGYWMDNIL